MPLPPPPPDLAIAGVIGVGKTTMASLLCNKRNGKLFKECVVNNPYLSLFYNAPKKYAFQLQIKFLQTRLEDCMEITANAPEKNNGGQVKMYVQDRTIYEDLIFAKMLHDMGDITDLDYNTYIKLFHVTTKTIRTPDVIVWLRATPEECFKRINIRNRECETGVKVDYLVKLDECYNDAMDSISSLFGVPVLQFDIGKTIKSVDALKHQLNRIDKQLKRTLQL